MLLLLGWSQPDPWHGCAAFHLLLWHPALWKRLVPALATDQCWDVGLDISVPITGTAASQAAQDTWNHTPNSRFWAYKSLSSLSWVSFLQCYLARGYWALKEAGGSWADVGRALVPALQVAHPTSVPRLVPPQGNVASWRVTLLPSEPVSVKYRKSLLDWSFESSRKLWDGIGRKNTIAVCKAGFMKEKGVIVALHYMKILKKAIRSWAPFCILQLFRPTSSET